MRIAIDARKLDDYGIGSYIRGLVVAMALARPADEFLLIGESSDSGRSWPENVDPVPDRSGKYGLMELLTLGRRADEAGADLFHAPHYVFPARLSCPGVVTIHDCIHLRFPEQLPRAAGVLPRELSRRYALGMMRHAAGAASMVLTVSEASATDLVELVGVEPDRIRVVHNGCDPMFRRPATEQEVAAAQPHVPGRPYALFIGNDKPHKNLAGLIRAMEAAGDQPPLDLLVAGGYRAPEEGPLGDRIHAVGRVDGTTLRGLVDSARMVVVPSLFEGFGLPALEAMAAGIPVVAAAAGGLTEVVGEAGLLVDPGDDAALTAAIRTLRDDNALHSRLSRAGREQAAAFTWQAAAESTLEIYDRVLAERAS